MTADEARCRGCGRPIVWIVTVAGKRMPCDGRVLTVITDDGRTIKGREAHWSTCPEAARLRSPR